MKVEVDDNSGFCFGVLYAIEMAEDFLTENGQLYCLGDIVHNDMEVARLQAKGLEIINHDDLKNLKDTTVLIRAHGEPPATYQLAMENNINLIDASCPVVLKLQHRVRQAHDKGGQIVIFGKPGHAEVNGLVGQTRGDATVVLTEDELEKLDKDKPVTMFSQTTKSTKKFYALKDALEEKHGDTKINDTICRQVSNREPDLQNFSREHDVVVFVAGRKSSNGKVLFEACKAINPRTHFISELAELDNSWFANAESVGICGATSTPMWLMDEVKEQIEKSA